MSPQQPIILIQGNKLLNQILSLALALVPSNAQFFQKQETIQPQVQQSKVIKVANGGDCWATGTVSVYDDYYQGRSTANGESFDQGSLTIAVLDGWPFGWYTLTNLSNGRAIRVYGNDKGAFGSLGRVADLSAAAFSAISGSGTINEGLLFNVCITKD